MSKHSKSRKLLKKFLKETPKERIKKLLDEVNEMDFGGHPTVKEYFDVVGLKKTNPK